MKFVLGAAQLGMSYGLFNKSRVHKKEFSKIEKLIFKSNISFIDTAPTYGNSERIIGNSRLRKLKIITKIKIGRNRNENIQKIINQKITKSLLRLNTKSIYGLMLHDTNDILGKNRDELLKCLKLLKRKKLVKKIGISIYSTNELDKVWKFWRPDIVQLPFNLFDQRMLDSGWMDKLNKNKTKIFARSCFLQGLLIGDYNTLKIPKKIRRLLQNFNDWCKENDISRLKASLDFIRQFKKIDFAVIGFNNADQMREILNVLKKGENKITKKFKSNNLKLIDPRKWSYRLKTL